MESIDSRIPKMSKQVGFSDKQCALCKKHGGPYKSHNTHDCRKWDLVTVISLIPTVLLSKGMWAQEAHKEMDTQTSTIQIRENAKRQFCSDNSQRSKESIPQAVSQVQETLGK